MKAFGHLAIMMGIFISASASISIFFQNEVYANTTSSSLDQGVNLPDPQTIASDFEKTTNEDQRFNLFNRLNNYVPLIVKLQKEELYIDLIKDLAQKSKNLGDANWISEAGFRVIKNICEAKINEIVASDAPIPSESSNRQFIVKYIKMTSEDFRNKYLNTTAMNYLKSLSNRELIATFYSFSQDLRAALLQDDSIPEYQIREADELSGMVSFRVVMDYRHMSELELRPWLTRLNPNGMQKVMSEFRNDLVTATQDDMSKIKKIIWASRVFYDYLFEKYGNDPFNDWQYINTRQLISNAILRFRKFDWALNLDDVDFLISRSSYSSIADFAEQLTLSIVNAPTLTSLVASELLPIFEYLSKVIDRNNIYVKQFTDSYQRLKILGLPRENFEGFYSLTSKQYKNVIIAFVNDETLSAGFQSKDSTTDVSFETIDFDSKTGKYTGQTRVFSTYFHLTLTFKGDTLEGCVNQSCFTGKKVQNIPNLIEKYKNSDLVRDVTGDYSGSIIFSSDSKKMPMSLSVFFHNGELTANGTIGKNIQSIFNQGLRNPKRGFIYLSYFDSYTKSMRYLRAELDEKGLLKGVLFSSNRNMIGNFTLKKIKSTEK